MTDKANSKLFFGGVPTGPDVDRIFEALGVPEPGIVGHETLAAIIGEEPASSRYRTVVKAWRDRLFNDHNVATDHERGIGVKVLTPEEWVRVEGLRGRGVTRHAVKVHNFGAAVPVAELDARSLAVHDHQQRFLTVVAETALREHRDLRKALRAPKQIHGETAEAQQ